MITEVKIDENYSLLIVLNGIETSFVRCSIIFPVPFNRTKWN